MEVERLFGLGALIGLPNPDKLRMPLYVDPGVTLRVIRSVVERETAQTVG